MKLPSSWTSVLSVELNTLLWLPAAVLAATGPSLSKVYLSSNPIVTLLVLSASFWNGEHFL